MATYRYAALVSPPAEGTEGEGSILPPVPGMATGAGIEEAERTAILAAYGSGYSVLFEDEAA